MTPKKRTACLTLFIAVTLSASAFAISPYAPKGRGQVGPKVGLISRTTINANNEEHQTKINVSFGLFFDVPVSGPFFSGVAVDLHNFQVLDQQQFFLDFSVPLKYTYAPRRAGIAVKTGVAVGLGHLAHITFMDATNYLTLKGFVELHYLLPKMRAWVFELGVVTAPTGGNSDVDSSIDPILYSRIGFVL